MREVNGSDLLGGSDHEFVVNLYTIILNRWPDEEGYRHYLQRVENRPDLRRPIVEEVAGSAEARGLGVMLRFGDEPAAPAAAAAAIPAAAGDLAATLAQLREGLSAMSPAALAETQRLLAESLAAVAVHQAERVERRLAALEARLGA